MQAPSKGQQLDWINITVHDKGAIIAYFPTTNASASDVSTFNEALNRSLTITRSLHLTSMICVFDKAPCLSEEGRNSNRGVSVHKLAYEAFMRVVLEGFYPCLEESHSQDSRQVQKCLHEIGTLADELSKERHDEVFKSFPAFLPTFFLNTLSVSGIPIAPF